MALSLRLNWFTRMKQFLVEVWAELQKTTWPSMQEVRGTTVVVIVAVFICAVFLFVPLFLSAVVAGEREERTLELLFTTHLTNRQIILGKLGSRVAALVCLILCGLPVMSFIMLFGGIDPDSLVRVLAATLLAVLFAGAHAIYFSTVTRSPLGALVRTYWWLALWLIGVPVLIGLFIYRPSPLLILMALLAAPNVMKAWRGVPDTEQAYYIASAETRFNYGLLYLGLAGFLAVMCDQLHQELPRAF